jgi:hypothetical protein
VTTKKQEAHERLIFDQLVAREGEGWLVVDQPGPPAPDGIIATPSGERIYVELVSYRVPGVNNQFHSADDRLKRDVDTAWKTTPAVQECSVCLSYAKRNGRPNIPFKPGERARAVELLIALVRDVVLPGADTTLVILRRGATAPDSFDGTAAHPRVVTTRHPDLARYFTSVSIRHHPGIRCLLPRTSLNNMTVGVAGDHIRRLVSEKLGKDYVQGPFRPLWLVIHADGFPMPNSGPMRDPASTGFSGSTAPELSSAEPSTRSGGQAKAPLAARHRPGSPKHSVLSRSRS